MNVKADPLDFWFHESVSCLHDCMAMILRSYAKDPIELLGARWSFHHNPTEVSQEEFYYPSPTGYLGSDLAPYHDLKAQWKLCIEDQYLKISYMPQWDPIMKFGMVGGTTSSLEWKYETDGLMWRYRPLVRSLIWIGLRRY